MGSVITRVTHSYHVIDELEESVLGKYNRILRLDMEYGFLRLTVENGGLCGASINFKSVEEIREVRDAFTAMLALMEEKNNA
jgi:Fe-S cluster assembly iron-binding protein IscA